MVSQTLALERNEREIVCSSIINWIAGKGIKEGTLEFWKWEMNCSPLVISFSGTDKKTTSRWKKKEKTKGNKTLKTFLHRILCDNLKNKEVKIWS